jgi:copper chaperone NosL
MSGPAGGIAAVLVIAVAACGGGPPGPAALDTHSEACRFCRMTISDARFAAQVVAPGEEPLFFDDIGCLDAYAGRQTLPAGATVYVVDHRTRAWVLATTAVFTRVEGVETPMNSHLVAHTDAASRDADPAARGGRAASLTLAPAAGTREGAR